MSDNPRVVRMNESTSRNFDSIPLPARQQLGYFDEIVDVDARSGRGVDALRTETGKNTSRDYGIIPGEAGAGSKVREVTYHLDSTPPPAEPEGAPGSDSYNRSQAREGRNTEPNVHLENRNNATTARQHEDEYVSTQRAATGRNERMMAAVGQQETASVHADEEGAARVVPSRSVQSNSEQGTQRRTVAATLSSVGDDKDKAREELERERNSDNPRSSLISKLEDIINDDDKSDEGDK